ncbi:MAG: hypothetical protein LBU88_00610 [Treponema sp.]|jgi:hypothetical protein|nr:hypothetical protein [Treponema sp.]
MNKLFFLLLLITLLFTPLQELRAQSTDIASDKTIVFDPSTVPQWAKDLRRFDIILFGTLPFTMLFTTLGYDLYLRYNPALPGSYHNNILLISAGASFSLALVDIIITVVKRSKEQRRLESVPAGSYEIEREPYGEPEPELEPD